MVTAANEVGGAREALLEACERLLRDSGYASLSVRKVAEAAGVNHGLVHYYFGSMEQLVFATFERSTDRLVERQRSMYAGDRPFIDKWRTAMGFMDEDLAAGYPKVASELHVMAMNHPSLAPRLRGVYEQWWAVLDDAFTQGLHEYGLQRSDFPLEAAIAAVVSVTLGVQQQRLIGYERGQRELLALVERWIESLDGQARRREGQRRRQAGMERG